MNTYNLTDKEMKAAVILTKAALRGMGGKRPADFEHDELTWVELSDLTNAGYSRHEAAGLLGSLEVKGFLLDEEQSLNQPEAAYVRINTPAWRWIETIWDQVA